MTLGFPVRFHFSPSSWRGQVVREGAVWPPDGDPLLGGQVSIPDRLAPLSAGSMLRHQPLPDAEFLDALAAATQALWCSESSSVTSRIEFATLQAIAALGAGLLPPPHDHALIGVWPAVRDTGAGSGPSPTTLVLTLSLVGASLPTRTGFIRASLPSGWILFQRRSPALHPFLVHDIRLFAQLCTGHRGPIAFVTGSSLVPLSLLGSSCSLYDIRASDASPYVPPVTHLRSRSPELID